LNTSEREFKKWTTRMSLASTNEVNEHNAAVDEIEWLTKELANTRKLGMEAAAMRFEENQRLAGIIKDIKEWRNRADENADAELLNELDSILFRGGFGDENNG
jgi:hypothetical protein